MPVVVRMNWQDNCGTGHRYGRRIGCEACCRVRRVAVAGTVPDRGVRGGRGPGRPGAGGPFSGCGGEPVAEGLLSRRPCPSAGFLAGRGRDAHLVLRQSVPGHCGGVYRPESERPAELSGPAPWAGSRWRVAAAGNPAAGRAAGDRRPGYGRARTAAQPTRPCPTTVVPQRLDRHRYRPGSAAAGAAETVQPAVRERPEHRRARRCHIDSERLRTTPVVVDPAGTVGILLTQVEMGKDMSPLVAEFQSLHEPS